MKNIFRLFKFKNFKFKAFSLVELLVVVGIFTIISIAAVGSLRENSQNKKAALAANRMLQGLNFVMAEAGRRRANVRLCAANAARTACDCIDNNMTANGWLITVVATNEVLSADEIPNGYVFLRPGGSCIMEARISPVNGAVVWVDTSNYQVKPTNCELGNNQQHNIDVVGDSNQPPVLTPNQAC
ncbi:MAG: Tfp pilus assembly protein FimT/FimU [Gammaproteobacteria bacterium]